MAWRRGHTDVEESGPGAVRSRLLRVQLAYASSWMTRGSRLSARQRRPRCCLLSRARRREGEGDGLRPNWLRAHSSLFFPGLFLCYFFPENCNSYDFKFLDPNGFKPKPKILYKQPLSNKTIWGYLEKNKIIILGKPLQPKQTNNFKILDKSLIGYLCQNFKSILNSKSYVAF